MKFKKYNYVLLFIALAICMVVVFKNNNAAEQAIVRFHEQYNNGEFAAIWDETNSSIHDISIRDKNIDYLQNMQKRYGKVDSSYQLSKKEVNKLSWTRKIEIVQKSVFEKGEGTEIFTFEFVKPKALLIGYNVK